MQYRSIIALNNLGKSLQKVKIDVTINIVIYNVRAFYLFIWAKKEREKCSMLEKEHFQILKI